MSYRIAGTDVHKKILAVVVSDESGCELHTISDPEGRLPVFEIRQVISIGQSRMVESVTLKRTTSSTARVYDVRVWTLPAAND
jgi:hypothetical protein